MAGMKIAVIGGTGPQGRGLSMRWAKAGVEVIVGSRVKERAEEVAAELSARVGSGAAPIVGMQNADAAAAAPEIVVLTVPYSAHVATLESIRGQLRGKILVDVTVPLAEGDPKRVAMPPEGSATEQARKLLGDDVRVVAALQNVSAKVLDEIDKRINCDVLVCGDDEDAKKRVRELVERLGVKTYDAGPAESARCVEHLTAVLIRLNLQKENPFKHASFRIWPEWEV